MRFFDRLDLTGRTKEEVSCWIDEIYASDDRYERAWDKYKVATNHDFASQDPTTVPVGAFRSYMTTGARKRGGSLRRVLIIAIIAIVALIAVGALLV